MRRNLADAVRKGPVRKLSEKLAGSSLRGCTPLPFFWLSFVTDNRGSKWALRMGQSTGTSIVVSAPFCSAPRRFTFHLILHRYPLLLLQGCSALHRSNASPPYRQSPTSRQQHAHHITHSHLTHSHFNRATAFPRSLTSYRPTTPRDFETTQRHPETVPLSFRPRLCMACRE